MKASVGAVRTASLSAVNAALASGDQEKGMFLLVILVNGLVMEA